MSDLRAPHVASGKQIVGNLESLVSFVEYNLISILILIVFKFTVDYKHGSTVQAVCIYLIIIN